VDGVAIGGSLGREKAEMRDVVRWGLEPVPDGAPRHLLGIGDVDDVLDSVAAGIDSFDCATPTRLARHGTALVADPDGRWRVDLAKSAWAESPEPIAPDCPCFACRNHTRAYLHYLLRIGELTGARLLTVHNLTFMAALMNGIRQAIAEDRFDAYAAGILGGGSPY
jgi:queuine tRNA-ribosyltransferase